MSTIQLHRVTKCFTLEPERPRSFQELVLGLFHREQRARRRELLWALKDVSFTVERGETVGLIGANGSGKSTCLKLLTRIIEPTSGTVTVNGRVAALLELGAGFHPELTGRENVFLHGSVMGMSRREVAAQLDGIVAFAELERFIDVPVKFYSSGMYVRLAFASAITVQPDILLIDEVLAVGDQHFQSKCVNRIAEMQAQGVTIVYVSHDLDTVARLCDRVLWLDQGRLRREGCPDAVLAEYVAAVDPESVANVALAEAQPVVEMPELGPQTCAAPVAAMKHVEPGPTEPEPPPDAPKADTVEEPVAAAPVAGEPEAGGCTPERWGSGRAQITDVYWENGHGSRLSALTTHAPATLVLCYEAHEPIDDPVFGVAIHRADGVHVSGCNTRMTGYRVPRIDGRGEVRYCIDGLPLAPGDYRLSVAVHRADEAEHYDYLSQWFPFHVADGTPPSPVGITYIPASWQHRRAAAGGEGAP